MDKILKSYQEENTRAVATIKELEEKIKDSNAQREHDSRRLKEMQLRVLKGQNAVYIEPKEEVEMQTQNVMGG